VQVVDCWVTLIGVRPGVDIGATFTAAEDAGTGAESVRPLPLFDADVPVLTRHALGDAGRPGPLLIEEASTITVVPPGARAHLRAGHLVIEQEPTA
jgi:hypothetical protein